MICVWILWRLVGSSGLHDTCDDDTKQGSGLGGSSVMLYFIHMTSKVAVYDLMHNIYLVYLLSDDDTDSIHFGCPVFYIPCPARAPYFVKPRQLNMQSESRGSFIQAS